MVVDLGESEAAVGLGGEKNCHVSGVVEGGGGVGVVVCWCGRPHQI